jgi:hypothetical protein
MNELGRVMYSPEIKVRRVVRPKAEPKTADMWQGSCHIGKHLMPVDADDLIILKHTWSLATQSIRIEFRDILIGRLPMPTLIGAPYAAPIRIWERMSLLDQTKLLRWIEEQLTTSR